ncbi:MAG: PAS domain S-box protein [Armatimonadota bacterium]
MEVQFAVLVDLQVDDGSVTDSPSSASADTDAGGIAAGHDAPILERHGEIGAYESRREDLRPSRVVAIGAILLGAVLWVVDSLVDWLVFYEGSLTELMFTDVPPHEIWVRGVMALLCVVAGGALAWVLERDERTRRDYQESIERSERRYETLVETMPDGLAICDTEGRFTYVNEALAQMLGYEPEALVGRRVVDTVAEPERADMRERIAARLTGGASGAYESAYVTKGGERLPVFVSATSLRDDEGRIIGGFAVIKDITQLKEHEQSLERLHGIVNRSPAVAITWAPGDNWPVDYVSRSIEQFGYTPEQFVSGEMGFVRIVHPEDVPRLIRDVGQRLAAGDDDFSHEYRIFTADEEIRWIDDRTSVVRDEDGAIVRFDGVLLDITDRKQAEEALRDREQRYLELVQNANDIIYTLTPEGTVKSINGAVQRILGFAPEEIEGRNLEELLGPERHRRAREQYLRKLEEHERSSAYEFELLNRDGEEVALEISTTIVRKDGEPAEVMGIARDITDRKRAEEELRKRTHALGERVKEMRCLYHVARLSQSHDQPVERVLQGVADMLAISWQWPRVTTARVEFAGEVYEAGSAEGPPVARQSASISVHGETVGRVEVRYHDEMPEADEGPFLVEERALIDTIAASIGEMVVHRETERERDTVARFPEENPLPVLRVGEDGVVDYANDAAVELLRALDSEVDQPAPEAWRPELEQVMRSGRPRRLEVAIADRTLLFTFAPVPEHHYVNIYGIDITARKAAEVALLESERRFRRAIAEAPFPIMLHAEDGEVISTNRVWTDLTGYGSEKLSTLAEWMELAYGEHQLAVKEHVERLFSVASPVDEGEFELRTATGETRIWHFHTAPLGHLPDGRRLVMSIAADMTERRAAENALRESERRYRTVFENTGAATCLIDADTIIVLANEGFAQLAGAPRAEIEGSLSFTDLVAAYEVERMVSYHTARRTPGGEAPNRYEFDFVTLDGETRRVFLHIDTIPGTKTSVASLVDVTELRRTQTELRALTEELEERVRERTAQLQAANEELEAFAYSVSHDLRAPLRAIDGFSQAVVEDYADTLDETGRDYLQRVRRASQKMGQLIDDILQLSRITRAELKLDRVDLSALAAEIIGELREESPDRSVDVVIEPDLTVDADRRLLRTALKNLLGNAWKYTGNEEQARIELGSHLDESGRRVYHVADNGAGFEMEYAGKLFQPFQRLHREDEFPGVGVGLATVRRIIRRHGGSIRAEGAPGQGATFYFTLQ